jgi:hypothetical protein
MGSLSSPAPPTPAAPLAQPSVFDPTTVAQGQQGYNVGSALASQAGSNYNQNNYLGDTSYTQTGTGPGGVPIYSANVNLSPSQQQLLTTLQGSQQTAGNEGASLLASANYGNVSPATAIGNETSGLTGQLTSQELAYQQPQFTQQTSQLDTQLRNEGMQPGEPGYDQAMTQLTNQQDLSTQNFIASTQPQIMSEATTEYGLPASLATSLASFGAPTNPTTANVAGAASTIQPTNLIGAETSAQNAIDTNYGTQQSATTAASEQAYQTYQAQLAQQNAMMSGIFGIGSTLLGAGLGGGLGGISGLGSIGYTDPTAFGSGSSASAIY